MRKYFFTQRIIQSAIILLTRVQLIVLRLISINVGVVKCCLIMTRLTTDVILPELETVVTVTNSSYSTVIQ